MASHTVMQMAFTYLKMTSVHVSESFVIIALIPLQNRITRNVQLHANVPPPTSSPNWVACGDIFL